MMRYSISHHVLIILIVPMMMMNCAVKWHDCGGKNSIIKYNAINLEPFPLVWGQVTQVTANFTIGNLLTSDIESNFKIGPLPFTKNLPIPCLGSFGSCTGNLCEILSSSTFCNFVQASTKSEKCLCPIQPSVYSIVNFAFQVPPIPPILTYFARGEYRIHWRWVRKGDPSKLLGCIRGIISFT